MRNTRGAEAAEEPRAGCVRAGVRVRGGRWGAAWAAPSLGPGACARRRRRQVYNSASEVNIPVIKVADSPHSPSSEGPPTILLHQRRTEPTPGTWDGHAAHPTGGRALGRPRKGGPWGRLVERFGARTEVVLGAQHSCGETPGAWRPSCCGKGWGTTPAVLASRAHARPGLRLPWSLRARQSAARAPAQGKPHRSLDSGWEREDPSYGRII